AGVDATWQRFHVVEDQIASLEEDVQAVRSHPLIPETARVGGFLYDVETGIVDQRV
ncbi:MAG: carbonic anhydrase, partial [Nocardioides sp.]|nr:carbonic anhydrase [Nocardioides sp.]